MLCGNLLDFVDDEASGAVPPLSESRIERRVLPVMRGSEPLGAMYAFIENSIGLLRRPAGPGQTPVLISWGGIDSFKEERRLDSFFDAGFAGLSSCPTPTSIGECAIPSTPPVR